MQLLLYGRSVTGGGLEDEEEEEEVRDPSTRVPARPGLTTSQLASSRVEPFDKLTRNSEAGDS